MPKAKRPIRTVGPTVKVATGCGNSYVTCNTLEGDLKPFEVFCHLGKAGGCATCQSEALTRSITIGLRYGVPVEEYARQLAGLGCPSSAFDSELGLVKSCPEGIAKAIAKTWMTAEAYQAVWKSIEPKEGLLEGQQK